MRTLPIAVVMLAGLSAGACRAEGPLSPVGFWITHTKGAVIEIFACDSGMCGRVAALGADRPAGDQPRDTHNPNVARRNDPICGIEMMGSLRPVTGRDGAITKWENGWVYDPETGDTYSAEMSMDGPDTLKLRGYLGISLLGRSETWTREGSVKNRCTPVEPISG